MSEKIEYRVIPHDRWMIVRFHSDENGAGSEQRGEFMNEREAEEVATLLAKAEDGAVFISRSSLNKAKHLGLSRPASRASGGMHESCACCTRPDVFG